MIDYSGLSQSSKVAMQQTIARMREQNVELQDRSMLDEDDRKLPNAHLIVAVSCVMAQMAGTVGPRKLQEAGRNAVGFLRDTDMSSPMLEAWRDKSYELGFGVVSYEERELWLALDILVTLLRGM